MTKRVWVLKLKPGPLLMVPEYPCVRPGAGHYLLSLSAPLPLSHLQNRRIGMSTFLGWIPDPRKPFHICQVRPVSHDGPKIHTHTSSCFSKRPQSLLNYKVLWTPKFYSSKSERLKCKLFPKPSRQRHKRPFGGFITHSPLPLSLSVDDDSWDIITAKKPCPMLGRRGQ